MQAGDVRVTYADTSLLESLTGYKPKIKLKEGLKMFSDWYLNHGVINKL
jgi:UDP-glucuronate 4-epimerase